MGASCDTAPGRPAFQPSLPMGPRVRLVSARRFLVSIRRWTEALEGRVLRRRLDEVSAQPLLYPYWHQAKAAGDRLSPADLTLLRPHL